MRAFFICTVLLAAATLSAQAQLSIEYPVGTTINHTGSVDLGDNPDRNPHNLTVRIRNIGTSDLTLDTSTSERPVAMTGASGVDWVRTQPVTSLLQPTEFVDFNMTLTPNDKGKWSVLMSVYSDDPATPVYQVSFRGSAGKEKKEKCSTGDERGGWLMLLAALSAAAFATRLRRTAS